MRPIRLVKICLQSLVCFGLIRFSRGWVLLFSCVPNGSSARLAKNHSCWKAVSFVLGCIARIASPILSVLFAITCVLPNATWLKHYGLVTFQSKSASPTLSFKRLTPSWWNGRHTALKMRCCTTACEFDSRRGHLPQTKFWITFNDWRTTQRFVFGLLVWKLSEQQAYSTCHQYSRGIWQVSFKFFGARQRQNWLIKTFDLSIYVLKSWFKLS